MTQRNAPRTYESHVWFVFCFVYYCVYEVEWKMKQLCHFHTDSLCDVAQTKNCSSGPEDKTEKSLQTYFNSTGKASQSQRPPLVHYYSDEVMYYL